MSLKPLKASERSRDQQRLQDKMKKKRKPLLDAIPPYMLILSEGTKTEVVYIKGLADAINEKYAAFSTGNRIEVKGTGMNCQSLLAYARKQVSDHFPQVSVIWLMYDKDDFPLDHFDNTQFSAEQRIDTHTYRTAWSNESLELWFVLHFQDLTVNVGRERYIDLLEKHCGYRKNDPNLFPLLRKWTDVAIARAKKLYASYPEDTPPSQRCPATRVFELVEDLQVFL